MQQILSQACLVLGSACIALGAVTSTGARSAFDPIVFGDRVAASLSEPAVARLAADRITTAVLIQSPDLTAVRPLILATAEGLATTEPFRAVVRTAARSTHGAVLSQGAREVVLAIPDMGVLLRSVFEHASPELAEKIPTNFRAVLGSFEARGPTRFVIELWELRAAVKEGERILLLLGLLLLIAAIPLAPDTLRGFVGAGAALVAAGFAVILVRPLGARVVGLLVTDPLLAEAGVGLWRTFMAELTDWGLFLGGLGVLCAGAATSVMDGSDPVAWLSEKLQALTEPPRSRAGRLGRGVLLVATGGVAVLAPAGLVHTLVIALGLLLAFAGTRELFRLFLDATEGNPALVRAVRGRRSLLRGLLVVGLVAALAELWILTRNPVVRPVPTTVTTCNGDAALCPRRLEEVVFAGTHNAMSNVEIPDWLFPHHQADIPSQLRDGVHALLIDVHYGFPGGSRIKTDLDGPRPTREALEHALGTEGVAAAERLRNRLVGVEEGARGLYLCHGFCEVGAYELTPTLAKIRRFLLQHPGEVLLIVVEDYVEPADLATAFEESGLDRLVYRGPSGAPWPTLRELILSDQRVVVFLESGSPGVAWLRPAFEHIQETPYTFHAPTEFACRANRGGTGGSLFQINHWIETTPAPRPSNAEIVNARDVLLGRARDCERERGLLPNVLAIDFYRSGDIFDVVRKLNGLPAESGSSLPATR